MCAACRKRTFMIRLSVRSRRARSCDHKLERLCFRKAIYCVIPGFIEIRKVPTNEHPRASKNLIANCLGIMLFAQSTLEDSQSSVTWPSKHSSVTISNTIIPCSWATRAISLKYLIVVRKGKPANTLCDCTRSIEPDGVSDSEAPSAGWAVTWYLCTSQFRQSVAVS